MRHKPFQDGLRPKQQTYSRGERHPANSILSAHNLASRVLKIDAHMIVLDKPAGLACHAGPKTPDSLERYLSELTFGFQRLPQAVHRLDRDTSGCLLLARHPKAHKRLTQLFMEAAIGKRYWAIVDNIPEHDEGVVNASLIKTSTAEAGWRMEVSDKGQTAETHYKVLSKARQHSLIEFTPKTGRTHQIRVHSAELGCPLVGDPVYGRGSKTTRTMLHGREICIPVGGGDMVTVQAELPTLFLKGLVDCGIDLPVVTHRARFAGKEADIENLPARQSDPS